MHIDVDAGDLDTLGEKLCGGNLRPGTYGLALIDDQIIGGERITDAAPSEMVLPTLALSYPECTIHLAVYEAGRFTLE